MDNQTNIPGFVAYRAFRWSIENALNSLNWDERYLVKVKMNNTVDSKHSPVVLATVREIQMKLFFK